MFKRKETSPMVKNRRKETIEKAKTLTIVIVFTLTVGIVIGFKAHDTLQSKYSKVPTVQVVKAAPGETVEQSK